MAQKQSKGDTVSGGFILHHNKERRGRILRKRFWSWLIGLGIRRYSRYLDDPRYWRPRLVILETDNQRRKALIDMALAIAGPSDSVPHFSFIHAVPGTPEAVEKEEALSRDLRHILKVSRVRRVYPRIIYSLNDSNAPFIVLQAAGLSQLGVNTVISDISWEDDNLSGHLRNLSNYRAVGMNVILHKPPAPMAVSRAAGAPIDVWLSGFSDNTDFLLLIPRLIQRHPDWRNSPIVLRMIVSDSLQKEKMETNLEEILRATRLSMHIKIIAMDQPYSGSSSYLSSPEGEERGTVSRTRGERNSVLARLGQFFSRNSQEMKASEEQQLMIFDIIRRESGSARLVVLGLKEPECGKEEVYARKMRDLLEDLPEVLLLRSFSGPSRIGKGLPDSAKAFRFQ